MKNRLFVLAVALLLASNAFGSHHDCFRAYRTTITNQSGGKAIVKKAKGISGISRKSEIPNHSAISILVKKRGAELEVSAGPEDNKSMREINFFSKEPNVFSANVYLNNKGVTSNGFYTKEQTYNVKLVNESGGMVKILDSCAASGTGKTLADGKSMTISVKPDGYIVVQSGPEDRKVNYRINFADQTDKNASITFIERGFMSNGIQHKGLDIRTQRVMAPKPFQKAEIAAGKKIMKDRKIRVKTQAKSIKIKRQPMMMQNRHLRPIAG